ncbi:ATP-binding protein [[Mycoplasma] testudinis]|uniref:ATP-binding protein n=1 Tax=[Mycoplasma] testudinis TaxID=33924 RepID=UPI000480E1D7|nr:DUF4143 domain-containing protein [[Mycoplasma] testudinis]
MIKRTIKQKLVNTINEYPVTLITGARQVGKSFLCNQIKEEYKWNYVSLDDKYEYDQAKNDPRFFLEQHGWPLIIDEIQKVPELFEYIAPIVNNARLKDGNISGMYLLTGSQQYTLMKNLRESLAGRIGILNLSTLSYSEITGREEIPFEINPNIMAMRTDKNFSKEKLYEMIIRGSYPKNFTSTNPKIFQFYSNYVQTYLSRDVNEIINIRNLKTFQNFIKLLALHTGQELVYESIAKDLSVDRKTLVSWVGILEVLDIIYLLDPYFESSVEKSVLKRKKIYFKDTGLACFLAGQHDSKTLSRTNPGAFVETYVFNEILKSFENAEIAPPSLYYYRDRTGCEIDLVLLKNGELNLVEIKSGTTYSKKDVLAFEKMNKSKYQIGRGAVICTAEKLYAISQKVHAIPISAIN